MDKNYDILTTSELKDEIIKLTEEFDKAKEELSKNYKTMEDASVSYERIKKIIDKREGKING